MIDDYNMVGYDRRIRGWMVVLCYLFLLRWLLKGLSCWIKDFGGVLCKMVVYVFCLDWEFESDLLLVLWGVFEVGLLEIGFFDFEIVGGVWVVGGCWMFCDVFLWGFEFRYLGFGVKLICVLVVVFGGLGEGIVFVIGDCGVGVIVGVVWVFGWVILCFEEKWWKKFGLDFFLWCGVWF